MIRLNYGYLWIRKEKKEIKFYLNISINTISNVCSRQSHILFDNRKEIFHNKDK